MAKKKRTYEENMARMEEIASRLESQSVSLEASIQLYQEGMELALECRKALSEAETKVQQLRQDHLGSFETVPFTEE